MARAREETHARVRGSARNVGDGGIRVRRPDGGRRGTRAARHFPRVLTRYGVVVWEAGARPCRGGTPAAAPCSRYLVLRHVDLPLFETNRRRRPKALLVGLVPLTLHIALILGALYATLHAGPSDTTVKLATTVCPLAPAAPSPAP